MARDDVPGGVPGPWVVRAGRIGGTEIQVSASCLVLVVLLAVAFAPRAEALVPGLGARAWVAGAAVGVLVYVAALVHELAHAAVAHRHRHRVPWIRLGIAGGQTSVRGESRTPGEEAATAVAGPLVSLVVGLVALLLRVLVDDGVPALVLEAVLVANLLIGLIDLVPARPLDGGRMVHAAAWWVLGSRHRGAIAAARISRGVAVTLLLVPVLWAPVTGDRPRLSVWVVCLGVAVMIWGSSSEAFARSRLAAERDPVGHLVRPVLVLAADAPMDDARRRAAAEGAAGIVVVDGHGRPVALVADVAAGAPAEPVDPGTLLPVDCTADQVIGAMMTAPTAAYVVVDATGAPVGLVRVADVQDVGDRR
ncbi:hypothetical protein [Nocardioides sp.]|uniref:hypothetical protein n=1 Tax=Nocardioides sp. TaxID=35761 RepID=UPI0027194917|nr:hypothetical protein [Nocardioides sp.]MDO9456005.1 hypothetical protein [Nocardioides sp.]